MGSHNQRITFAKKVICSDDTEIIRFSEILDALKEDSAIHVAAKFDTNPYTIKKIIDSTGEQGVETSSRRMRELRKEQKTLSSHLSEVIAMRLSGHTYEEIGQKFEVSRERVRQVLARAEALHGKKYTGIVSGPVRRPRKVYGHCPTPGCGKPITQRHRMYCDDKCRRVATVKRNEPLAKKILQLRLQGKTWFETAKAVGFYSKNENGTGLCNWVKRQPCIAQLSDAEFDKVFPNSKTTSLNRHLKESLMKRGGVAER